MIKKYFFLLIGISASIVSCNQQNQTILNYEAKQSILLKSKPVDSDHVYPTDIFISGNYLFIIDPYIEDGIVSMYDIVSDMPRLIIRFGKEGTGPGEYLGLRDIEVEGDSLYMFDITQSVVYKYSLRNFSSRDFKTVDINRPKAQTFDKTENGFVVLYHGEKQRGAKYNNLGEVNHKFGQYPDLNNKFNLNEWEFNFNVKANIYQANTAYNKGLNLIAISHFFTDLVEVFDLNKNELSFSFMGPEKNFPPDYQLLEDGRSLLSFHQTRGYSWIDANEKSIYLLNCSKTFKEDFTLNNQIIHFDWSGHNQLEYKLENEVFKFAVNEKNTALYKIDFSEKPLSVYSLVNEN